jgi:hypothetical protein
MQDIWKEHPTIKDIQISNTGRVKRISTGTIYSVWKNKWGYNMISMSVNGKNRHYQVHRLVTQTFLGMSDLNVNHIDFNKSNNCLDNLEYMTQKENINYSKNNMRLSQTQKGKINYRIANEIRHRYKNGEKQVKLALEFNISPRTVCDLIKYRTWKEDLRCNNER